MKPLMHQRPGLKCLRCTSALGLALRPAISPRSQAPRTSRVTVLAQASQSAPVPTVSDVVSDQSVPEGHAGLHNALYGSGEEHSATDQYHVRKEEDDGSVLVALDTWLHDRDGERPLGVYAIYNQDRAPQYIGYSRNMVTAVRGHLSRVGAQKAAFVRAMVFGNRAMSTREQLECEVDNWVRQYAGGVLPPGNATEREAWDGAGSKVLSQTESQMYADKAAKLKRAMGEGRKEGEAVQHEHDHDDISPEEKRANWRAAVEGGNWSEVIDRQTQEAVGGNGNASSSSSSSSSSNGHSPAAAEQRPSNPAAAAAAGGPPVSPFMNASVHRSIGEGGAAVTSRPHAAPGPSQQAQTKAMTVESVDSVLNEVRPYLMADGGDVEVVEVKDGNVYLRLQGACSTCASSQATMKMGIERALKTAFGNDIKEVIQLDKVDAVSASASSVNLHLDMLRGAITSLGGKVEVVDVQGAKATIKYKGPAAIGKGVSAAIRDRFPEIKEVVLLDYTE